VNKAIQKQDKHLFPNKEFNDIKSPKDVGIGPVRELKEINLWSKFSQKITKMQKKPLQ
jgi:hypothetical protein